MQISEHSVRERAYYIWEDEGRVHGRATAHWVRAETELRAVVAPVAVTTAQAPAKSATKKAAAKPVAAKPVSAKAAVAKPVAPKVAKASKAAVTAGLAAKTKAPRAPAAMH